MDFRPSEDQRDLRRGIRELLAGRFGREALRAAVDEPGRLDRGLWKELGEAGFFALRLPEEEGGVGLGLPEAVLLFEEAGRALLPGPLVATHLAAGAVPGAAEGLAVVTGVSPEGLVPWLDAADAVRGDAAGAVPMRSVDPLTPLHRVPRTGRSPAGAVEETGAAGAAGAGDVAEAALLTAAEQVGTAGWCTDAAVSHALRREQFGQVIGGFQAVKHLCAGMLVRTEVARAAVQAAAVTADRVEIAGAKLLADEAAVANARDCLQVHGGMGFTWEADVHLHLKRAWVRAALVLPGGKAAEEVASAL
ncbi:acyl-CoA dehydrogenase family protein [Streptomyces griseus]|uniref:acyl-CoA dehydrogenase family protein n=1 Tax=Streptomyces griseus TaxID=1911 RepID=UPI0004C84A1F|nr:acyl-CoA dehydrogenase family protein [Streptomyces griseus]